MKPPACTCGSTRVGVHSASCPRFAAHYVRPCRVIRCGPAPEQLADAFDSSTPDEAAGWYDELRQARAAAEVR